MLLKILTHWMAGSVTFCFDGCFDKWFQHVSSVIIGYKDLSVAYIIATVQKDAIAKIKFYVYKKI